MTRIEWVVGTDRGCDVRLTEPSLNGRHCRLHQQHGRWSVEPLDGNVSVEGVPRRGPTEISPDTRVELVGCDGRNSLVLPWPSPAGARGVWTIGRSPDCDVMLDVPNVSGKHGRLILGQHGSWVLEDLGSTNGLYVDAERTEPVRGLRVVPEMIVYFGVTPVSVSVLIDGLGASPLVAPTPRASAEVKGSQTESPASSISPHVPEKELGIQLQARNDRTTDPASSRSRADRPKRLHHLGVLLTSLITLPLLAVVFTQLQPDRSQPRPQESIAASIPRAPATAEPKVPQRGSVVDESIEASAASSSAPTSTLRQDPQAAQTSGTDGLLESDVEVSDAMYWVLIELPSESSSGASDEDEVSAPRFRLGTAVAVSPRRLITTGSVILAAEELQEQLGGVLRVMHLTSQRILSVREHGVHDQLVRRMSLADAARQKFDETSTAPESAAQEKDLRSRAEMVDISLLAVSAVDAGWLGVEKVAGSFEQIGNKVNRRPRQSLQAWHAGFDAEDPFWDQTVPPDVATIATRLGTVTSNLEGIDGPSQFALATVRSDLNLFGSPVMSNGTLVGIISYSSATDERVADATVSVEAVAPSVLAELISGSN